MKTNYLCITMFAACFLVSLQGAAQIGKVKIEKPKVKVEAPDLPKAGGSSDDKKLPVGGVDPSGLFLNVTDDVNAQHHRKTAVANLSTLEAELAKDMIDYDALTKLIFENERTLGHIRKLEPNVNSNKYDAQYQPLKARADKENAMYARAKELEKLFDNEFGAPTEYKTPGVIGNDKCYCRQTSYDTKTYDEYAAAKKEYEELTAQLAGYKNDYTQQRIADMETCLKNGNQYVAWASKDNVAKEVVAFSTENQAAEPKRVIARCDEYAQALDRLEKDKSLSLDATAKAALTEGRATIAKVKSESELYISSGRYQQYLDKMHAEKIAKTFLPKAAASNSSLEQGAMNYIKGAEYNNYLGELKESTVASATRAVVTTAKPYVKKNDYDIPVYQYHEIWVAYKGKDGKCYMAAVYASYEYKGGGTYATIPTWSADAPEELSCANVSK